MMRHMLYLIFIFCYQHSKVIYGNIFSNNLKKIYEEHHNEEAEHYCMAEMDPICPLMQEAGDLLKDAIDRNDLEPVVNLEMHKRGIHPHTFKIITV